MTRPHEELREALGAYALGQLDDPGLRRDLEQHLGTCDTCPAELADIAPVVAGLRLVDPERIRPVGIVPPPELDDRIRRALPVVTPARRRWAPAAVGALVGAAAATLAVLALPGDETPAGPTVIAVPQVESASGVSASAGLVDHTWGLEIKLTATGLPAGEAYEMWVTSDDGSAYEAGRFVGVEGTTIRCNLSTSLLLRDAASFTVVDPEGDEVISADLPSVSTSR